MSVVQGGHQNKVQGGSKGGYMGPCYGPFTGSEVWGFGLSRAYKGYMRGPLFIFRAHTKGPCNFPT